MAQKSSHVDLPLKVVDLETQAAREGYGGAFSPTMPDNVVHGGTAATEAVDALWRIKRARP